VPIEGVVHALREVHNVLVPGGLLVDTQPISPRPAVESDGSRLGTLDMREWRATIDAVEHEVRRALDAGLFAIEEERSLVVIETFDNGPELVDSVSGWRGTKISRRLVRRAAAAPPPLTVHQEVRLRVLRAAAGQ
jgi:hypothetical protein